jgi:O-antigen/teichoic acid export membrane protein
VRVGSAFLQTFATQAIQSAASIATGILIARGLGPSGQGQYAVLAAIVGLAATLAAAGQFEGHVVTSAGERSHGRVLLVRSFVQALAVAALLALTHELWRGRFGLQRETVLPTVLALVLLCEILALLLRGINLGQHHIGAYNLATLVQRLVYLGVLAMLAGDGWLRVETVFEAWLAAVGISVALSGAWIWRRSDAALPSWTSVWIGWGVSLSRGLRALLTIGLTLLLVRADVYMLSSMVGAQAVGQISVASTFGEYLWYIPSILASVLFAAVAASHGPETVAKVCRASRITVAIIAPAAVALAVAGRTIVRWIYGDPYAEAGVLFVLLLPGMSAIALHLVVDSYFAGVGFPWISYAAAAGALALKVILNLIAIPQFGIKGAAVTTSGVYLLLLLTKVVAFTKRTGVPVAKVLHPTWSDVTQNLAVARTWVSGAWRASA